MSDEPSPKAVTRHLAEEVVAKTASLRRTIDQTQELIAESARDREERQASAGPGSPYASGLIGSPGDGPGYE
ncbi:hypothetical protein [Roseomonas sp. WA12]